MKNVPYGYRIVDAKAVIDESEATRLRTLFGEYNDCGNMLMAARNAGIVKTHSVIGAMLKNRAYLGTDFYPRLIDDETFEKAQKTRLDTAARLGRVRPPKERPKITVSLDFTVGVIEKKYKDPYLQAQYAYGQIQEKRQ